MHQQAALKKDKTIAKSPSEEDDFLNELDAQQRNMEKEKLALQYELEKIKHEYSIASSEIVRVKMTPFNYSYLIIISPICKIRIKF